MRKKGIIKNALVNNLKNIDTIKEKIINNRHPKFKLFKYIIITFILAFIYVWERVEIDAISLNINKLKEIKSSFISNNEFLKAEIENKTRFESIEKVATSELNMEFPGNNSTVFVLEDKNDKTIFNKLKEFLSNLTK